MGDMNANSLTVDPRSFQLQDAWRWKAVFLQPRYTLLIRYG